MTSSRPIELEQARAAVLERAHPLGSERVSLRDARGRYLAEDVVGSEPVPAFDNSAMDGFAVRAGDTQGAGPGAAVALAVVGESRAGRPSRLPLAAGQAVRISTGAVIPDGADAVVRVEDTLAEDGGVLVRREVEPGDDVRRAGEDVVAGAVVLSAGARLGAAELGVLASLGVVAPACARRPRVAVLTSGDELLEPGEEMRAGGVRNSNAHSVPALAEAAGADVVVLPPAADDPEATWAAIGRALDADVAVLCGGVSVGEHDHVRGALLAHGVEQAFWRVALKPGKPVWFGTRGETLVFGLPGNPVSAMVTFVLFVQPALALAGGGRPEAWRTVAKLARAVEKRPGRAHAARCRLELREDGWLAHPAPEQGSHVLTSMLGADCLALLPAARGSISAGEAVEVELLPGAIR